MAQSTKDDWKIKIMLAFELITLIMMFICFLWLKNVLVGFYSIIFITSIFLWLVLVILTVNLKNRMEQKKNA